MSFEGILATISLVFTALIGIGAFINATRTNRTAEKKLTVEEQSAQDDKEATVAQQRLEELNRLHPRLDKLEVLVEELKGRLDAAEKAQESSDRQTIEMIHHIVALEALVPNPPGPPTRPNWKLPLLTDR